MAIEAGVELHNGRGLGRVVEEEGKVTGLAAKRCLSVRNSSGRFDLTYDEEDGVIKNARLLPGEVAPVPYRLS